MIKGNTPGWRQSKTLLTIEEHRSKIEINSVFDCHLWPAWQQMTIENSVSNVFLPTFVHSINIFDCRLTGVGKVCMIISFSRHTHWSPCNVHENTFSFRLGVGGGLQKRVLIKKKLPYSLTRTYMVGGQNLGLKSNQICVLNLSSGFPTRSYPNQPAQLQSTAELQWLGQALACEK